MSDFNDFNRCVNWQLRCYEQKMTERCITLRCSMNSRKKDKAYTTPVYVDVVCIANKCDIPQADYAKKSIRVDGRFYPDEYTTRNGETRSAIKIFADKVTLNDYNSEE